MKEMSNFTFSHLRCFIRLTYSLDQQFFFVAHNYWPLNMQFSPFSHFFRYISSSWHLAAWKRLDIKCPYGVRHSLILHFTQHTHVWISRETCRKLFVQGERSLDIKWRHRMRKKWAKVGEKKIEKKGRKNDASDTLEHFRTSRRCL